MKVIVTIEGTLDIPEDDFDSVKSQGVADLATILIRNGSKIQKRVARVQEKKGT